jgi:hypothetical protein
LAIILRESFCHKRFNTSTKEIRKQRSTKIEVNIRITDMSMHIWHLYFPKIKVRWENTIIKEA